MLQTETDHISFISHELRTPLTSLQAALKLILDGYVTDPAALHDIVKIACRNTEHLAKLVNDLLDVNELEPERFHVKLGWISVATLLSRVYEELLPVVCKADCTLVLLTVSPDIFVRGDYDRLTQVLSNLISNATKFTYRQDRIDFGATVIGGQCNFFVSDHGPSIPSEFREKIFSKYYQCEHAMGRLNTGSGLGLAICKDIVEAHGGNIGCYSEPHRVTSFFFSLQLSIKKAVQVLITPQLAVA